MRSGRRCDAFMDLNGFACARTDAQFAAKISLPASVAAASCTPKKSLSTTPLVNLGWQVKDMYYEIINGKGLPKQHAFLATAKPDLSYLDYFEDSGFHFDGSLSGGKRSYEEEANEATTCGAMKKICMGMPRAAILGARQMRRSM